MVEDVEPAHEPPPPSDHLEGILHDLAFAGNTLPEPGILAARAHRLAITPRLIEAIRNAAEAVREERTPEPNPGIVGLMLLLEFQATEAWPAFRDVLDLTIDQIEDVFDAEMIEVLTRAIVILSGGRVELLEELLGDRSNDEYVRWSAADGFKYLVRDGRLSREEAVERLRPRLRQVIADEDHPLPTAIATVLMNLAAHEARDELFAAFDEGHIDELFVSRAALDAVIAAGEQGMRARLDALPPSHVDTLEELRHWASFSGEEDDPDDLDDADFLPEDPELGLSPLDPAVRPAAVVRLERELDEGLTPSFTDTVVPIIRTEPRVGRNDPCPCGSGKKFKKCCGRS